jgi:LPS export ABC transporter protein LptC
MPGSTVKSYRMVPVLLLLAVLVATGLHYTLNETQETPATPTPAKTETPQFFLEQAVTTRYHEDGSIDYQFNSEHLDYFKSTDNAIGHSNYFIFFKDDGLTWHARSDRAVFLNNNHNILLTGNVRIWQPLRHLELTTDEMTFDEPRQYAETSKPVTLNSTSGVTRSTGMKVDLNREKLQLLSAVTGTYHVQK